MKYAFIIFGYYEFGGLEKSFFNILNANLKSGHTITVLTMNWTGHQPEGINVITFPKVGITNHRRISNFCGAIKEHLAQHRYDLVVGFNKVEGLDVYYAGDVCYHNYIEGSKTPIVRALIKLTPRFQVLKRMEASIFSSDEPVKILAISEREKSIYQEAYGTPEERFYPLPPGIHKAPFLDVPKADILSIKQQLKLGEHERILLMVGSKFKTKGVDRAVKAIPSLIARGLNVRLVIVGDGDAKPLLRIARKTNTEQYISFVGPQKQVAPWMHASALLLHLSLKENTGNVIIEALISGLPVIATDTCGYANYITEADAGDLTPNTPFDQASFNHQLYDILSNTQRITQWSENALDYCKEADLSSRLEKVVTILETEAQR